MPTGTQSALRYGSVGNPNLKPERGSEIELGFESSLFGERIGIDATYYSKTTRDALIPVGIAPSSGFVGNQLTNLGTISNSGLEIVLNGAAVRRKSVTVEATLSMSTNRNRLISFGDDRDPIIFGSYAPSQRYRGYPLGAMWAQRVPAPTGRSSRCGTPVIDTASVYIPCPTRELSPSPSVRCSSGSLRTLLDYKAGHYSST